MHHPPVHPSSHTLVAISHPPFQHPVKGLLVHISLCYTPLLIPALAAHLFLYQKNPTSVGQTGQHTASQDIPPAPATHSRPHWVFWHCGAAVGLGTVLCSDSSVGHRSTVTLNVTHSLCTPRLWEEAESTAEHSTLPTARAAIAAWRWGELLSAECDSTSTISSAALQQL